MILDILKYIFIGMIALTIPIKILQLKYPPNRYKAICKYGQPGVGKTNDINRYCIKYLREGWNVYTNVDVQIEGVRKFDPKNWGRFTFDHDSVVLIDEVGIIWNARDFKSFDKKAREYTKLYRHAKIILIVYSQANDADITLRRIFSEEWIMQKYFGFFSWQRRLKKRLQVVDPEKTKNADEQLITRLDYCSIFESNSIICYYMPKYFKYNNTYDMPYYPAMPYVEQHGHEVRRKMRRHTHEKRKEMELPRSSDVLQSEIQRTEHIT